jgi:hypothetical protein
LANGTSATILLRGTPDCTAIGTLSNTATVTSPIEDTNNLNNTKSVNTDITDNTPPTFNAPAPFAKCVENLTSAVYNGAGNADDNITYIPDYNHTYLEGGGDYSLFEKGSTQFNLNLGTLNYTDNCCKTTDVYSIRWEIDFVGGPEPTIKGTGQPSTYKDPGTGLAADIKLWGDGIDFNIRQHTITYWITDCHGNESLPVSTIITINPRPKLTKMP